MLLEAQLEKQSDNQATSEEIEQVHEQVQSTYYSIFTETDILICVVLLVTWLVCSINIQIINNIVVSVKN